MIVTMTIMIILMITIMMLIMTDTDDNGKNADNDDDNFACRPHMTLRGCECLRAIQLVTVLLYTGRALL